MYMYTVQSDIVFVVQVMISFGVLLMEDASVNVSRMTIT